jgi:hypothetical protein
VLGSLAVATSDGHEGINALLTNEMRRFDRYRSPVVITASTDVDWIESLEHAVLRGVRPTVIYVDPESFDASRSSHQVRDKLALAPYTVHIVDYRTGIDTGFDWAASVTSSRAYFNVN